jgi:chromosomal replication initiation ATPase DnaA
MSDDVEYARWKGARSAEARDVWQTVSDRVRDEMTKGNWTIYFSRSRGLELTAERLVVGAPNTSAAEGLDTQFSRIVRRALDEQGHRQLAVHVVLLPTRIDAQGDEVIDVDGALADIPDAPRDVRLVAQ